MKNKLFFFRTISFGWNLFALDVASLQGNIFQNNYIQVFNGFAILIRNSSSVEMSAKIFLQGSRPIQGLHVDLYFTDQTKVKETQNYLILSKSSVQINFLANNSFNKVERMTLTIIETNLKTNEQRRYQYALNFSQQADSLPTHQPSFYTHYQPYLGPNQIYANTLIINHFHFPRTFNSNGLNQSEVINLQESPQQPTFRLDNPESKSSDEESPEQDALDALRSLCILANKIYLPKGLRYTAVPKRTNNGRIGMCWKQ